MPAPNMHKILETLHQPENADMAPLHVTTMDLGDSTFIPRAVSALSGNEEETQTLPESDHWSNEALEEGLYFAPFNLVHLASDLSAEAIFTRDLLQQIKDNKFAVYSEMRRPRHLRTFYDIYHATRFGQFKIWNQHKDDYDYDYNFSNCVAIRYMSRVELHPEFQRNFWKFSKTNRMLRVTNELQGKIDWVPVPYVLSLDTLASSQEHQSNRIMEGYWTALQKNKEPLAQEQLLQEDPSDDR